MTAPTGWEYAAYQSRSKWVEHEKRYSYTVKITAGIDRVVLADEDDAREPRPLFWSNWMGQYGWEMVSYETAKRAFLGDGKAESYPSATTIYFKRPRPLR
ncbi:hypothetical protein [Actinomycetospora aeridis]|uniref:Uncharacterized protein n=1 Tax=Actinomycetospora aeridis TaxID=3129231 RepID=A0ABU8NAR7_9PSEU